jgi:hypothetical protein
MVFTKIRTRNLLHWRLNHMLLGHYIIILLNIISYSFFFLFLFQVRNITIKSPTSFWNYTGRRKSFYIFERLQLFNQFLLNIFSAEFIQILMTLLKFSVKNKWILLHLIELILIKPLLLHARLGFGLKNLSDFLTCIKFYLLFNENQKLTLALI